MSDDSGFRKATMEVHVAVATLRVMEQERLSALRDLRHAVERFADIEAERKDGVRIRSQSEVEIIEEITALIRGLS